MKSQVKFHNPETRKLHIKTAEVAGTCNKNEEKNVMGLIWTGIIYTPFKAKVITAP